LAHQSFYHLSRLTVAGKLNRPTPRNFHEGEIKASSFVTVCTGNCDIYGLSSH